MVHTHRSSLRRALFLAVFCAFACRGWGGFALGDGLSDGTDPIRIRELYVPYDEFHALTEKSPDGVIMELAEYRELIALAAKNALLRGGTELPPRDAAVTSAIYRGDAEKRSVRFTGELVIQVARDGWVACPLGLMLPNLGSVLVDGTPGWMVIERGMEGDGKIAESPARAFLLLEGRGRHTALVTFSMEIVEGDNTSILDGAIIPAPASTLEVTLPGELAGVSVPDELQTIAEAEHTRFHLALGGSARFHLAWNRRREFDENSALLLAEHQISISPRPEHLLFTWVAQVRVARRKVAELVFAEPDGATVLHVSGDDVHSWERTDRGLKVILKEAVVGNTIAIRLEGMIPSSGPSFTVTAPRLLDAYTNTGAIALFRPNAGKLEIESTAGLSELDPSGARNPNLKRHYSFATPGASLRARIVEEPFRVDTQSAFLARVWENALTLNGLVHVQVKSGESHQIVLSLPAGWNIQKLEEGAVSGGGAARGLRFDEAAGIAAGERVAHIYLDRAIDREHPLEMRVALEFTPYPPSAWDADVALALPFIGDAERARTDLGISLRSAFYLGSTDLAGWRSLTPEETVRLGLENKGKEEEQASARVVAGLTTEAAHPALKLKLIHRPARGEYRAVTHVLAAERAAGATGAARDQHTLRVRADLRLAVVDRGIDEITFELPKLPADTNVNILGDGIKERVQDPAAGIHTVRFARPWLETRQFRIEYEIPCTPGAESSIPAISLAGGFGGERSLVIQSQGSVEVASTPGSGLAAIDIDDIPDFAEPWAGGRVLAAFRLRAGDPGTLRTVVHERAPVLAHLAREMKLETVIGEDGTAHTRAEFLLAYSREQALRLLLPAGARCIGVTVDGSPIRALRLESGTGALPIYAIPLPPRSFATISILYSASGSGSDANLPAQLGRWGSWSMEGPVLLDIPVGETAWKVVHPEGYRWFVSDGNLRSVDADGVPVTRNFAQPFLLRLYRGEESLFSIFKREYPGGSRALLAPLTPEEALGAEQTSAGGGQQEAVQAQRLAPRNSPQQFEAETPAEAARAPLHRLLLEGRSLDLVKFGGTPRVTLGYLECDWWNFSKRCVYASTLALALFLALRRRWRALSVFAFGGVMFGTLLPVALGWQSPLLLDPLSQALLPVLALLVVAWFLRVIGNRLRGDRALAPAASAALLVLIVFIACAATPLAASRALAGDPTGNNPGNSPGNVAPPPNPPGVKEEHILIPYAPEGAPWKGEPTAGKAFVPEDRFQELWRLAYPDDPTAARDPNVHTLPYRYAFGNAAYIIDVSNGVNVSNGNGADAAGGAAGERTGDLQGSRYRVTGTATLQLLTDDWVEIPLPFDRAQLLSIRVDGVEQGIVRPEATPATAAGAAQQIAPAPPSPPAIKLRGRGAHKLECQLAGKVDQNLGVYRIESRLLTGAAAIAEVSLPAGAVLLIGESSRAAAELSKEQGVKIRFELGGSGEVRCAWTFPKKEGDLAQQLQSVSYTHLRLRPEGLDVTRREKISVAGRPVDRVVFRVDGDWQIADVQGNGISDWSVTPATAENAASLTLIFDRAANEIECTISGRALVADQGAAPIATAPAATFPTLTLEGAVRYEAFAGLSAGGERRFLPETLQGMGRATLEELEQAFPTLDGNMSADRILHHYGSGAGEPVAVAPAQSELRLTTDGIALWRSDRIYFFLRARYTAATPGALRHEISIPGAWNVRRVQAADLESWEVVDGAQAQAQTKRLIVRLRKRAQAGSEIVIGAETPLPAVGSAIALPAPALNPELAGTRVEETWHWTVAADDDLDVSTATVRHWEGVPLESGSSWLTLPAGSSYRLGYVARRGDGTLELRAGARSGKLSATVSTFARLGEEFLEVNMRAVYRLRSATRDRFSIRLPRGAELIRAETINQRKQEQRSTPDGVVIEIELQSPVRDEQTIDVVYRTPRAAENQAGTPPVIEPPILFDGGRRLEAIDQYVGILQTVRTLTLETETTGLAPVELANVPYLPRGISERSLRSTYRATGLDWSLTLREQEIELVGKLDARIELAELSTVIGNDGTVRTQVIYTLVNQGLQFLTLDLPENVDLWGVTVNGQPVAVGGTGKNSDAARARRVMIPVEHAGRSELPIELMLIYEEPALSLPALFAEKGLTAPRIVNAAAIPIAQTIWSVHFPDDIYVTDTLARMRQAPVSLRSAEKLRTLLDQQRSVLEVAKGSESNRARQRAAQELSRIEAALSDNLAELKVSNRGQQEQAQSALIGEKELSKQWSQNDAIINDAQVAQQNLRQEIQQEKEKKPDAGASRDEEAFRDRTNFLRGQAWQGQEQPSGKKGAGESRAPAEGRADAQDLLEEYKFYGFGGVAAEPAAPQAEVSAPKPIDPGQSLKPLADSALSGSAPGVDLAESRAGYVTYTFRRMDGDAALGLRLSSHTAIFRAAAWVLIAIAAAATLFIARRWDRRLAARATGTAGL